MEAKEAAKIQEDAQLTASEAEAEAKAKAIQEVDALSATTKAPSIPFEEPEEPEEPEFGPRPFRFPLTGLSKEDTTSLLENGEWSWTAQNDYEDSDSDDSTEKRYREEYTRARAEEMERAKQGSSMKGKTYLLIGAEARDKLLGDEGLLNLDPSPPDIDIEVRVDGYDLPSCKKGPLRVETSFVWVVGSNGTKTLEGHRTFHAQELGYRHGAPTESDDEEEYKHYSEQHGKKTHELQCMEEALYDARREKDDLKLLELMQMKKRAPSTPTSSNSSLKILSPDSALCPPDSPSLSSPNGEASKNTKNRRPSCGPRKKYGYCLPQPPSPFHSRTPPSPPNGPPVHTPTPLEGTARAH